MNAMKKNKVFNIRGIKMKKQLQEIQQWLGCEGQLIESQLVKGVSIDSRHVQAGDLFIPFRGEQTNGHLYVEQAIKKGAVASLWLKDEPHPPTHLPLLFVDDTTVALQQLARHYRSTMKAKVIGITGSNGKTSTKDIVSSLLSPYFKVEKTLGNLNNELGLPMTLLNMSEDTEIAVLEMGMSNFGEIEWLTNLARPDYAIITNIGEAHLQDLGSREGIAKAKFEIVEGLSEEGTLFYDGDEPLLTSIVTSKNISTVSFGFDSSCDLQLVSMEQTAKGTSFQTRGVFEGTFQLPVLGEYQAKNALPGLLIGRELGLSIEQLAKALEATQLTEMRMQLVPAANEVLILNDAYNAAPTSMKAALQFVEQTTIRPRKIVVLADMLELGEKEEEYHRALAPAIENIAEKGGLDAVLLLGPRMKWLKEELKTSSYLVHYEEEQLAPLIHTIQQLAQPNETVVFLKGSRGMALERIVAALEVE